MILLISWEFDIKTCNNNAEKNRLKIINCDTAHSMGVHYQNAHKQRRILVKKKLFWCDTAHIMGI